MRVLIATESSADDRKTLAAVRALAGAGADVSVSGDDLGRPPFLSRHCRQRVRLPNPRTEPEAYLEALCACLADRQYDVLLPLSDYPVIVAVENRSAISRHAAVPVPSSDAYAVARDKLSTLTRARDVGLGVPQTLCPESAEALDALRHEIRFPCVLKLRRGAGGLGFGIYRDFPALRAAYVRLRGPSDALYDFERPLIQESVPGPIHDVGTVFDHGRCVAAVTSRRIQMYPAHGGPGVFTEVTDDAQLRSLAITLLSSLAWHGPAQVEFKRDERDGAFKLMEINGRFWGTLGAAIAAGVNMPLLACRAALGETPEAVAHYQAGLRYRWPLPYGWRLARTSKSPWRMFARFFLPARGVRSDIEWTDPRPNLAIVADMLRGPRTRPG